MDKQLYRSTPRMGTLFARNPGIIAPFAFWICLLAALGLVAPPFSPAPLLSAATPADLRRDAVVQAIEKISPSVVNIRTLTKRERRGFFFDWWRDNLAPFTQELPPQYSAGSGVIIDETGFVLTNVHVVEGASQIWVRLWDGTEIQAVLIAGARQSDIALLKLRGKPGQKFPVGQLAEDDDLLLGETVIALGNPFGLGNSVSRGILSAKSRTSQLDPDTPQEISNWIQTDAAINPGNSGGPLINLQGEIIGLNVAIYRQGQGIGFAIPVKRVREALAEIYTPERIHSLWFGAQVAPVQESLKVLQVQAASPAEKGGLKTGDLILKLNQNPIASFTQFVDDIARQGAHKSSTLLVQRGKEQLNLSVQLVPEKNFFNADLIRKKIGARVVALSPDLAEDQALLSTAGLMITAVDSGGPAAQARLQPRWVIQAIEGQPATDLVSAARLLYSKKKGQSVSLTIVAERNLGALVQLHTGEVTLTVN